MARKWTKQEKDYLKNNYGHLNIDKMAQYLNRTYSSVQNALTDFGLRQDLNKQSRMMRLSRLKYSLNEDKFKKVTIESCYWAGFIAADGCIEERTKHANNLKIELSNTDKQHLTKLKDFLQYTGPVRQNIKRQSSILCISSDEICNSLVENFNITPFKTFSLKPPSLHIDSHILAFIKGFIDGDGCISTDCKIQITCASKEFLTWLVDEIYRITGKNHTISPVQNKYFKITISDKNTKQKISKSTKLGLDRKWSKL